MPAILDSNWKDMLEGSLADVLETMCFTSVLGPGEMPEDVSAISARVDFRGEAKGKLWLSLTQEAAASVAADFLGVDRQDLTPEEVEQVLAELTNITCGRALSRYSPEAQFDLTSPVLDPAPADTQFACFELMDGFAKTALLIEH